MSEAQELKAIKNELHILGVRLAPELEPYIASGPTAKSILTDLLKQARKGKEDELKKIKELGIDESAWRQEVLRMEESRLLNVSNQNQAKTAEETVLPEEMFENSQVREMLAHPGLANLPLHHTNPGQYVNESLKSAINLVDKNSPEKGIYENRNVIKSKRRGYLDEFNVLDANCELLNGHKVSYLPEQMTRDAIKTACEQVSRVSDSTSEDAIKANSYAAVEKMRVQNVEYINQLLDQERNLQEQAMNSVRKQIQDHVARTGASIQCPKREEIFANVGIDKELLINQVNNEIQQLQDKIDRGIQGVEGSTVN